MAILNQKRILNLIPKTSAPVTIHVSQGDVGTEIEFTLVKGDELFVNTGNLTASVHGAREDGANFGPFTCTLSGSKVTFPLHSEMTAVKGSALAEIVLVNNSGNKVGSSNFGILIEQSAFPLGVTYDNDVSVYESILAYVQTNVAQMVANLNAEISARQSADSAEASTRAAADTALGTRIDNIIAPSGEAPSAAEVQDARLTINGISAASLGDSLRSQTNQNNENILKLADILKDSILYEKPIPFTLVKGRYLNVGFNDSSAYCRIAIPVPYKKNCGLHIDIPSDNNTYLFYIYKYVSDTSGTSFVGDRYRGMTINNWVSGDILYISFYRVGTPTLTLSDYEWIMSNVNIYLFDYSNAKYRNNIDSGADLDKYVEDGHYALVSTNILNKPNLAGMQLEIKTLTADKQYLMQFITSASSENLCFAIRIGRNQSGVYTNNGSGLNVTWKAWNYSGSRSANYNVLCLGDSIIGYNQSASNGIPSNIQRYTPVKECLNGALGGTRATKRASGTFQYYDFPSIVDALVNQTWTEQEAHTGDSGVPSYFANTIAMLKALDMSTIDIVIVNYGGNDYTSGVFIGEVSDAPDRTTFLGSLTYELKRLYTAFPNVKIILVTPPYKCFLDENHQFIDDGDTRYFNAEEQTLADFADSFSALGKKFHAPVVDLYNGLGINKYNRDLWLETNDGSHPSANGCDLTGKYIAEEINRL